MATIFRNPIRRKNPETGKESNVFDAAGKQMFHSKWRTVIVNHKGQRKTYTFGTNKLQAQKQADMLETREREIKNGVRAVPASVDTNGSRDITEVMAEYMAWGRAQGGKRGMPWADADKKERCLATWQKLMGFETLSDVFDILPKTEKECRKMLAGGNTGKTVSNKVLDLRAFLRWCKKRKYITEDPLAEMSKFDITPQSIRRAMTVEELRGLLAFCAPHRRLLYEVAFCTGLRANEMRKLEPHMLDHEECAIRLPKHIDKGRKNRVQYIPVALMERLIAFIKAGEAKKIYARTYRQQGNRPGKKKPPANPLLYVPTNSATMIKKDLEAAGIPTETPKGYLDFHALRTAYINFVLDVAPDVKTAQELARHETPHMTLNVYGRAKEEKCRAVVESVGNLVFQDNLKHNLEHDGQQNYTKLTQGLENVVSSESVTAEIFNSYNEKRLVREGGLEPPR